MKKIPSLIDMHTHLRDFDLSNKETIETGLRAAIKGGFGAVLNMPNTKPVCDNWQMCLKIKEKAAPYSDLIDLYPVGAVTIGLKSDNTVDFKTMKEKGGAIAFSNDGFSTKCTLDALKTGELILSHLEDETKEAIEQIEILKEAQKLYKMGLSNKPRLHFCHISKKSTIEVIKKAKDEGLNLTAETCPHYFTFTKENITETGIFKMNPPLGTTEDKLAVIEAVKNGVIDVISTDHAPHEDFEKLKPYNEAPNGITGLECAFSLTLETFGLDLAIEKMSIAPSKILGIKPKREITIDTNYIWRVKGANFESKCKVTPYENMILRGKII